MLSLLGSLGSMLRNVFALSFAAICGLSSMLLNVQQISDLAWNSAGGAVLVLVLIAMGLIAGFVILVYFLREKGRKERARLASLDEDRGEDFDPDMIIARHLAYRASAAMPPRVHRPAPQRPRNAPASFGRKQL